MIEVRVHGRGGQGAVTTAQLLAIAAFHDGKYAQAFPYFGVERRGAPSTSFIRISGKPISERSQIYEPDYVMLLDASLMQSVDVKAGLKKKAICNSVVCLPGFECVDATKIAMKIFGKPLVNTVILGSFAKITGVVSLNGLLKAMDQRFKGEVCEQNKKAVTQAYEGVR